MQLSQLSSNLNIEHFQKQQQQQENKPSIFCTLVRVIYGSLFRSGLQGGWSYPSCHQVRARVHPEEVSRDETNKNNKQQYTLTPTACWFGLWAKPKYSTQTRSEDANSAEKASIIKLVTVLLCLQLLHLCFASSSLWKKYAFYPWYLMMHTSELN